MRLLATLSALVLLASACGDGGSEPENEFARVAGSYALTQVNAGSLPALVYEDPTIRIDITSGNMTLRNDGSFTETLAARATFTDGSPPENESFVTNGTYSIVGSQVTWSVPASGGEPGVSWTGAVANGVVTYTWEGTAYRFVK